MIEKEAREVHRRRKEDSSDWKKRAFGFNGIALIIYYLFISNKDPYHSLLRDEGKCRRFVRVVTPVG